jgi:hypothetical protein
MTEGPEWFAPKRYGYGAGLPIAWQGWALTIGFIAITVAAAVLLAKRPLVSLALLTPLLLLFTLICARTTKGGWRWRWGRRD